jgi:signal transduction histidine kinase
MCRYVMTEGAVLEYDGMRRLVDVGRALLSELDPEALLDRVLETAREITGARYAALGILDERGRELERFIARGMDDETRRAIGELPRGHGVLGVLIEDPRPLRLADVGLHPRSYGFPAGHPPMRSFLGVPILVRGEAWGNLYLTDKQGSDFDEADEEATVVLAEWAAIAIENARLYQRSERRRAEHEKALRGLQATQDIIVTIGEAAPLERVLELIVKRGRALVDARSVVILLRDGDELEVAAHAGYAADVDGVRVPLDESMAGEVMRRRRPERIADVAHRVRIATQQLGVPDARSAMLVPLVFRDRAVGALAAFDRGETGEAFSADDEQVLRAFAAGAATAVAMTRSVEDERLRHSLATAEAERTRWARDLHDETLQGLSGVRMLLASALREGVAERTDEAAREAIGHIERQIENLRAIVADLRPAALEAFGLGAALESLVARHRARGGPTIEADLALPDPEGGSRLAAEIEATIYRLVQEGLANAARHARAEHVQISVAEIDAEVFVQVRDDGVGFDVDAETAGFGLAGMRERVRLAGGTLTIESGADGTVVRARLPAHSGPPRAERAARDQAPKRPRRSA